MERADADGPPFRPSQRGGVFRSLRGGPSSDRAVSPLALLVSLAPGAAAVCRAIVVENGPLALTLHHNVPGPPGP